MWYDATDDPDRWDNIMKYVKSGYMPFGDDKNLTNGEIQSLIYWQLGGYKE